MSLKKVYQAIQSPRDLFATIKTFRDFGAGWRDAFTSAVECIVNHRFILL